MICTFVPVTLIRQPKISLIHVIKKHRPIYAENIAEKSDAVKFLMKSSVAAVK